MASKRCYSNPCKALLFVVVKIALASFLAMGSNSESSQYRGGFAGALVIFAKGGQGVDGPNPVPG